MRLSIFEDDGIHIGVGYALLVQLNWAMREASEGWDE
jgi:hypothetical protein